MVLCDEGEVALYGAVIFSGEPVYDKITGGKWSSEEDYMVVHRLCVAAEFGNKGLATEFMERGEELARRKGIFYFRIDTHPKNIFVQKMLLRLGFEYRGDVYFESLRVAFEKKL